MPAAEGSKQPFGSKNIQASLYFT